MNQTPSQLENRMSTIERELRELKNGGINRYLDNSSKDLIGQIIDTKIIDIVWDKYFYFLSYFEASEGWDVTSASLVPVSSGGLTLQTTVDIDDMSNATKNPKFQKVMSFDEESRFRTMFYLGINTTAENVDYSMTVGTGLTVPLLKCYGFRLEDNILYGVCCDGTNETKVAILTTDATQGDGVEVFVYLLEARFFPGQRCDFYVSAAASATLVQRATIRTTLPTGGTDANLSFNLVTREAVAKQAFVGFVEYIQVRPIR